MARKSRKSYPDGGETWFPFVAMSANPYYPTGFCEHGEMRQRYSVWGRNEKVLEIGDLPEDCQKVITHDLEGGTNDLP